MEPNVVIDIGRQALYMTALLSAPVLLISMVVGILVGVFQAVTQIHEMTLAFIPKILVAGLALIFTLPWMITEFVDYTVNLFQLIPGVIR